MPTSWEITGVLAQLILALAALLVAVVALRLSKQAGRIETHRQIKDAFNALNTIALSDPENLRVLDELETPQFRGQSLDEKRRRWLAAIELNALESVFVGKREGLLDVKYADATLSALVPLMVQHVDVCEQINRAGYDPDFVQYCVEARERHFGAHQPSGKPSARTPADSQE
jgi:hypothetical protein